jgi:hypothetical protein
LFYVLEIAYVFFLGVVVVFIAFVISCSFSL